MSSWRRNQIAVVAATFVGFTGFTLVMPFLSRYIQELGVTDPGEAALWTGITLGITPGIVALCAPLWGRFADRFGNKLLVQRSLFSCIVVMALMANATEPWHLVALRAAQGGSGEVVDEQRVGQAAEVHAKGWAQAHRGADPWNVRQTPHDRRLIRALQALVVACHALFSWALGLERQPDLGQVGGYPTRTPMPIAPHTPSHRT